MKASTNVISPPRRVKAQTGLLMTICSMRLFDMHGVFYGVYGGNAVWTRIVICFQLNIRLR